MNAGHTDNHFDHVIGFDGAPGSRPRWIGDLFLPGDLHHQHFLKVTPGGLIVLQQERCPT